MRFKEMKQTLIMAGVSLVFFHAGGGGAALYSFDYTGGFPTTNVPDGSPGGWSDSRTISGIPNPGGDGTTSVIMAVNVRLNISGGYNGDLYCCLRLHDENNVTVMSVVLIRV